MQSKHQEYVERIKPRARARKLCVPAASIHVLPLPVCEILKSCNVCECSEFGSFEAHLFANIHTTTKEIGQSMTPARMKYMLWKIWDMRSVWLLPGAISATQLKPFAIASHLPITCSAFITVAHVASRGSLAEASPQIKHKSQNPCVTMK
jgi:hypothetical protein